MQSPHADAHSNSKKKPITPHMNDVHMLFRLLLPNFHRIYAMKNVTAQPGVQHIMVRFPFANFKRIVSFDKFSCFFLYLIFSLFEETINNQWWKSTIKHVTSKIFGWYWFHGKQFDFSTKLRQHISSVCSENLYDGNIKSGILREIISSRLFIFEMSNCSFSRCFNLFTTLTLISVELFFSFHSNQEELEMDNIAFFVIFDMLYALLITVVHFKQESTPNSTKEEKTNNQTRTKYALARKWYCYEYVFHTNNNKNLMQTECY